MTSTVVYSFAVLVKAARAFKEATSLVDSQKPNARGKPRRYEITFQNDDSFVASHPVCDVLPAMDRPPMIEDLVEI